MHAHPRKIAIFGGTFDPVHLGHIHLASLAKEVLALDEVRFVPCRISPHKAGSGPSGTARRLEMLHLATAELPWAVVDDIEAASDQPSFSYLTAEAMAAKFPEARLFWIMGADQWEALPRWKHPERLARLVEFAVLPRGGALPLPREGYRLHVIEGDHPASATEIRAAFAAGAAAHQWLHPDVSGRILGHRLYLP